MAILDRTALEQLAADSGSCVSIFMPVHPEGDQVKQDPIRLKNLLREAENQLKETESGVSISEFLDPARGLLEPSEFWRNAGRGLALFLTSDEMRVYRLPFQCEESVEVKNRPRIRPLLSFLTANERFYILAVSQKRVRLLEGSRFAVREIDLHDIPERLNDVVGYDWEDRSLQFHTGAGGAAGGAGGGRRPAIFHGHGGPEEDELEEAQQFLRAVDEGVLQLLEDRSAPIVVAAVERMVDLYRETSKHPNILEKGVPGNPDERSPSELHQAAWELVRPRFKSRAADAASSFKDMLGTGRASDTLEELVIAAADGRVNTLFLERETSPCWGRFDPESREVERHDERQAHDEDLIDLTSFYCLTRGSEIYSLRSEEMPTDKGVAAIFRY